MDWIRKVKLNLERYVAPADRMLVAVSGGADSMGMLSLLHEQLGFSSDRIVIGHVQHGIRVDEGEDLTVIEKYARTCGLLIGVRRVDGPKLAFEKKMSLEAAARVLRYQALEEMAAESGCTWILTAHTLDDSAETVLMRIQNGGDWYEWTGVPARRGKILRPLLQVDRGTLRRWMDLRGLLFREDATNTDYRFSRNRVRQAMTLQPVRWNTQRKQELAQMGELAARAVVLSRCLARVLPVRFMDSLKPRVIGLAIDAIFIYFKGLKFAPVEVAWAEIQGQADARLPASMRRQVEEFLGGAGPESALVLPGEVRLIRRGSHLWLTPEPFRRVDVPVTVGERRMLESGKGVDIGFASNGAGTMLSCELARRQLRLRTWQPGDKLKVLGKPEKRISDMLNEAALDPVARENTLVMADEHGPLMILGGAVHERALPQADERNPLTVTSIRND